MAKNIRNFSIIAHIDHGKSTLADRLLEYTGALSAREMTEQVLDSMDLERERGITIKAHAVRLLYKADDGNNYILNLIDTPGHVDFSYEVSRSLASCDGALLVVDASQGVEAQTLANAYLALEHNLEIIPVINKIDLPSADPEKTKRQIEDAIGIDCSDAILASAKEGIGTREILDAIVKKIPSPAGDDNKPLKALIFDSWFDNYQGIIILVRVFDGKVMAGKKIKLMATEGVYEVSQVGIFSPKMEPISELSSGEVGYIISGIKSVTDTKIGDTITDADNPAQEPCPGYKDIKPMVFCGLYPTQSHQYENLRDALNKLRLNDSSFNYEPETSLALGSGFRCGFLGLLHMEIIKERLEREFDLSLLSTAPTVVYRVTKTGGDILYIENPALLPEKYEMIEEPFVVATIFMPKDFIGPILDLCQEKRGFQKSFTFIGKDRIKVEYELPLNEILWDFYDRLKSLSKGYASMDYDFIGFRESNLVKLNILINGEVVDALSLIVHKDKAYYKGRELTEKLREIIQRQMFEVVIQAAIGNKIISRESVRALRKDVIAKCYGGDITRKRKLLEKQKEGKKRMKQVGKIELPQEAFLAVLKVK
ncbi:MAG: elongation factor 4 [Nitrospirae bacterium CG_4_10_14_0_8_um_filter_41_23]|nr:elongation factor 4 [Nitrospirota bacterium]OIP59221.1 MAG: elongation factor 4 [Nitrospirae bacterium CG2_30_41_42]PIQ95273.1 MAG: elongation factor 4 [Nitrospirae bacterium CG11_big_fil_rev_8_21_14_0_20_41_14]PIV44131.1 MAG: elongation factor 4 [Nitrospirae bacterium CG02_land_8_20_14_3_00_41_53]PIW87258.1 MAG: elongation factor 4 [Nitrospirae bacterium CG_4_8_14_3_um_filter_41_47]PIY86849.1 MAG: elongation factor 4 [Nitrospirae bacterium CG_4_10_14_0_8_um_filter_41_23]PJA79388.1 MAG: el